MLSGEFHRTPLVENPTFIWGWETPPTFGSGILHWTFLVEKNTFMVSGKIPTTSLVEISTFLELLLNYCLTTISILLSVLYIYINDMYIYICIYRIFVLYRYIITTAGLEPAIFCFVGWRVADWATSARCSSKLISGFSADAVIHNYCLWLFTQHFPQQFATHYRILCNI